MNKCHSNLNWLNDTTPAINDTNLNYMDGCIDTLDDRVVAMDSSKLGASDVANVIKGVSLDEDTGIYTYTRYNDTTFTIDSSGQLDGIKDDIEDINDDISDITTEIANIKNTDKSQARDIANLYAMAQGELYREESDSDVSREKSVPSDACPFGTLDMLGGMSRKGKNLLQSNGQDTYTIRGITFTKNANGTISVTGTKTSDTQSVYELNNSTVADAIRGKQITLSGSKSSTMFLQLNIHKADGSWSYLSAHTTRTVEVPSDIQNDSTVSCNITVAEGTSVNEIFNPMLNEGTTALPFEPYTSSLVDAKVNKVEVVGRNLWDEETKLGYYDFNNGNYSYYKGQLCTKNYIAIEPEKSYCVCCEGRNERNVVLFYDVNKTYIDKISYTFNIPFTSIDNAKYMAIDFGSSYGGTYNNNIAIIKGSTATSYAPYKAPTEKSIPSSVLALDGYGIGINNTCYNYLEWADDKVYFHKRVGSVDLGSLNYTYVSSWRGVNLFYGALNILSEPAKFGGNALIAKYEIVSEPKDKACYYCSAYISGTVATFGVSDSTYTDAASFKSSMNGVILYYELATEVITDVTDLFATDYNVLEVEGGGTIRFSYPNDTTYAVDMPNKESYLIKLGGE